MHGDAMDHWILKRAIDGDMNDFGGVGIGMRLQVRR